MRARDASVEKRRAFDAENKPSSRAIARDPVTDRMRAGDQDRDGIRGSSTRGSLVTSLLGMTVMG